MNRDKINEQQRLRRKLNKQQGKAYKVLYKAIKDGVLNKAPCEICGNEKAKARHEDYSKPLEVKWICDNHGKYSTKIIKCKRCQKETSNYKFCSYSCAASYTQTNHRFQGKVNKCKRCLKETKNIFCSKTCAALFNRAKALEYSTKTKCIDVENTSLKDLELFYGKTFSKPALRKLAREKLKTAGGLKECYICGYSKHVQTCHIKAVSNFDKSYTINQINSMSNLVSLCPNCHWELDNGLICIIKKDE